MRRLTLLASVFAVTAMLLGALAAQAQQPLKIRIAWVVPVGNWASILYEKTDLMPHYGKSYEVEPVHFQGTPPMITALAANQIDIADFAYSSLALAIENAGMDDLRVIADEDQDGAHGYYSAEFMVRKDGPVKRIEDLKGKVIATVGAGSAVDIAIRVMLRKHGLEDKRDYAMIEASFPNMRALLTERKADLISGVSPFALDPDLRSIATTLFTAADALGGPTEFIVWSAREEFLKQHRAAMVDLLEDAMRAVRFFIDPKNHAEVVAIAAKITKLPPDKMDWAFTKLDDYHDPNMLPDLASLQRAIDAQQDVGLLKVGVDVKSHAELSLVREAAARIK
jgi:NitT/TauT family transport system substrate-binding protein